MDEVTCPYCESEVEINHDDGFGYDQNNREQMQCPECDKDFMLVASCIWSYEGEKADCLNDGEHFWKQMHGAPVEYFVGKQRCEACGKERQVTEKTV